MKHVTPRVSLITPTYRAEKYLAEFLHSVLAQEYTHMEFILISDGSDDASASIIQNFVQPFKNKGIDFIYMEQEHLGQAQAFNMALPLVTGKLLTWADSDDILHPQNISAKVSYMQKHPQCHMLRNNALEFDENRTILKKSRLTARMVDKQCHDIFEALFTQQTYCLAGCYMLKTNLFKQCYPHMRIPTSMVGQNLQILLPPASRVACHYLDRVLLSYRRHGGSHYHSQRGSQKQFTHMKALWELLHNVLPYCTCDTAYYSQLIETQRQEFWQSFRSNIKKP